MTYMDEVDNRRAMMIAGDRCNRVVEGDHQSCISGGVCGCCDLARIIRESDEAAGFRLYRFNTLDQIATEAERRDADRANVESGEMTYADYVKRWAK